MPRKTFSSFHFERDIWRACQVRNSGMTKEQDFVDFYDKSLWEESRKTGEAAIKSLIDKGLQGSSVTAVLIGAETASRPYCLYEIQRSFERGNALLGVRIHGLRDRTGRTDFPGRNPFELFTIGGQLLSNVVPIYDWIIDGGYHSFGAWIERAYQQQCGSRYRSLASEVLYG
jgi:hypothetical protein